MTRTIHESGLRPEVGQMVKFRNCNYQHEVGVVVTRPREERFGPGTGVYQVMVGGQLQFFTGNQMVVAS